MEIFLCKDAVLLKRYDPAQPVRSAMRVLENVIREEPDLKCARELLGKLAEMTALLALEQAGHSDRPQNNEKE